MTKEFNPLRTMRAIRADKALSTTQKALLMCAVLRTDNATCHVRYAVYLLAEDASMTEKTAGKLLKTPEVERYFAKVERTKRTADFWFHPEPPETVVSTVSDGNSGLRDGNQYRPSTSSSTSTTSTSDSADASSPNHKRDQRLEKGATNPSNQKATPEPETVTTTVSDAFTYNGRRYFSKAEVEKARERDEQLTTVGGDW